MTDFRESWARLPYGKNLRYTNREYLDVVKELPGIISGRSPCDPHHVVSRGSGGGDDMAVPLIRSVHRECEQLGRVTFEHQYAGTILEGTARALYAMYRQLKGAG